MGEMVIRFAVGGAVVAVFALLGDLFKPKSFAGVFAAAPSVALTTLALASSHKGLGYAGLEARSMIIGAVAFLAYTTAVCWRLGRHGGRPRAAAARCGWLWFAVATAGWGLLKVATS
jgi:hypothetical protein